MGKKSAPKPPDPMATAGAQTGMNIGTAIANQAIGNVNQTTPYGSLTYNQTGTYKFTDPLTGATYDLPQYTANQTLSPGQQRLFDTQTEAETNLAGLARDQSARLGGILGKPMDLSGAPQITAPNLQNVGAGPELSQVGTGPKFAGMTGPSQNQRDQFAWSGPITKSYSTDFSQDRQKVEDALMARMAPQLEKDRGRLEANLSNRGIKLGSGAYDRAIDELGRSQNDARLGAILGAGEEQSRMVGMEAARAGFENQAQQQQFNQGLTRGQFGNDARQQNFENEMAKRGFNNAGRQQAWNNVVTGRTFNNDALQQMFANDMAGTGFNNQVAQQGFGNQQAMRNQYLTEQYQARNQPINEIAALLGTGQVQNPNFINTQGGGIANTDYAGLVNQNYNQRLAAWQQNQANRNSMLGGLFGLGAAGIGVL